MNKTKGIWLSFDLGIGGDYSNLYRWLDNLRAIECGTGLAFLRYNIDSTQENNITDIIKNDITQHVNVRPGDRLYVIRMEPQGATNKVMGDFIAGARRPSPWEGYGDWRAAVREEGE